MELNMSDINEDFLYDCIGDMCDALVYVDGELRTADYLAKEEIEEYIKNTGASIKEIDEKFFSKVKKSIIDHQI